MNIQRNIAGLFLAMVLGSQIGCATKLDPAGPYGSDAILYNADLVITTSYDIVHTFVLWEYSNRDALAAYPGIKAAADVMRKEAPGLINSAMTLREQYAKEPTVTNRLSLNNVLSLLRKSAVEATKQMVEHSVN